MKERIYILTAALLAAILPACETDVDLFTEHGEVPVVFALLEPASEIQFFRINPTFKGEGDARVIAGDEELTSYAEGEIEAKLVNLTTDVEYLLKDSILPLKSDGIFGRNNRIYYLETDVTITYSSPDSNILSIDNEVLIAGHEYQLVIKNTLTGTVSTSTIILGDINMLHMLIPERGLSQFTRDYLNFYGGSNYNNSYTFSFAADPLSERFSISARFYYTQDSEDIDSKSRYVDFNIGERNEVESYNGFDKEIEIDFDGERFYTGLPLMLEPYPSRAGQTLDLNLTALGPDLDLYMAVQEATLSGLSQELPSFTNIENGLGVFSYRLRKTFTEFKLNLASAEHLYEGSYTFEYFNCARHGTQNNKEGNLKCRN